MKQQDKQAQEIVVQGFNNLRGVSDSSTAKSFTSYSWGLNGGFRL